MARIIDCMDLAKFGEGVTSCPNCHKVVAFDKKEVFLDLSYGPGHDREESIRCPGCNTVLHMGEFQATEHM